MFFNFLFNPLSSSQVILASHFHTDWLLWLGLGNQVGSTTDHLANWYLPSTPKGWSMTRAEQWWIGTKKLCCMQSHDLVARAITCGTREPGFYPSSFHKNFPTLVCGTKYLRTLQPKIVRRERTLIDVEKNNLSCTYWGARTCLNKHSLGQNFVQIKLGYVGL